MRKCWNVDRTHTAEKGGGVDSSRTRHIIITLLKYYSWCQRPFWCCCVSAGAPGSVVYHGERRKSLNNVNEVSAAAKLYFLLEICFVSYNGLDSPTTVPVVRARLLLLRPQQFVPHETHAAVMFTLPPCVVCCGEGSVRLWST